MAVPEQIPVVNYVADGIVKKFDVPFEYDQQSDLHIYVDGVEPTIDKYFFADNAFNFYITPESGVAIKIKRITPKERDTDYNLHTNTARPKALNTDFDRLWYAMQEVFSDVGGLSQEVQDEIIARIQGDQDLLNQLTAEISARMLGDEAVSADLKNYIDNMIALIIGDPSFNGINADKVNDSSGLNQQQINTFTKSLLISPMLFGAVGDGVADDTDSLNSAISFAITNNATLDGQGKTYACHSVLFDSNFKFKNAKLVCNKFDEDLVSVLECSSYNDDPRWLKNVQLWNIHIDGKRALHTGIKDTTVQEDGGRSGFRIIRPVDGLTIIGCSGIDCASDGIILFPHGDQSSINDTVKNVVIINSVFTGNRRHGGSSNSVNGMKLSNCILTGNGLDINPSAPLNSGLRGDTVSGQLYGSGWDCEEYALDVQSTNMFFNDCTMTGNAKSGLLVLTYGSPAGTNKAVIEVNGGSYDIGVSDARDNWAILVTPVTEQGYPSTKLFTANNVNLNGGDIGGRGVDNFVINHPVNIGAARALEMTTMFATGNFTATAEAASSVVRKTFAPDVFRFDYSNNLMQLNTSASAMELRGGIRDDAGGKFKVSAYRGIERGALEFRMNLDSGGTDLFYSTLGADKLAFYEFNLTPITNGGYGLGRRGVAYSALFSQKLTLSNLSIFETNGAAVAGGLLAGDVYRNAAGALLIVF